MEHYTGGQKRSSDSQLDFVSYWSDRTVKEAVLRGHQLRQEKANSAREKDIVNIDFIKPATPRSCCRRRKKSPKSKIKRQRSKSPTFQYQGTSQSVASKVPKRKKVQKTNIPCGMRIAELAVPTKRHCLETWKNKCNTLPDYMIERLRQRVNDERPVVQVSDAIDCFKRKCKRRKRDEKPVHKAAESNKTKINNMLSKNDVKVLSAIFGYKMAKKLIIPMTIVLNSDLQRLATVVSCDVENLMSNAKRNDGHTKTYKMIEGDVVKKITVWIVDVLEEASDRLLEDQLRDFEEVAGPALDAVDDLVDNALDICIPVPEMVEETSTSESDGSELEGGILEQEIPSEKGDLGGGILEKQFHSEKGGLGGGILENQILSKRKGSKEAYIEISIEHYFKNELVTLLHNIDNESEVKSYEYLDIDHDSGGQSAEDAVVNNLEQHRDDHVEAEEGALEQAKDEVGKDVEINDIDYFESENIEADEKLSENDNTADIVSQNEYLDIDHGSGGQFAEDAVVNNLEQQLKDHVEAEEGALELAKDEVGKDVEINDINYFESENIEAAENLSDNDNTEDIVSQNEEYVENKSEALKQSENPDAKNYLVNDANFENINDANIQPSKAVENVTAVRTKANAEEIDLPPSESYGDDINLPLSEVIGEDTVLSSNNSLAYDTALPINEFVKDEAALPLSQDVKDLAALPPNEDVGSNTALLSTESTENETALLTKDAEVRDNDEYLESDDGVQSNEAAGITTENIDDITEIFADATEENQDEDSLSQETTSDLDRKVTFDESANAEASNDLKAVADLNWKASIEHINFSEPNEDLLSEADESWPGDVLTPVLRPSQSVSKSVTSLGRIREIEESVKLEDNPSSEDISDSVETNIKDGTKPLHLEIDQEKPADSSEKAEKASIKAESYTAKSTKSKSDMVSKDSEKLKATNKRFPERKSGKPQSKKPTIASYKKPSNVKIEKTKPTKIETTKPIPKIQKKVIDKNIKTKSKDSESARADQTANDLESDVKPKDERFSTVQVKPKPDYRVNIQTAPIWIKRNLAEPSCTCFHLPPISKGNQKTNEIILRRWCQDLEQGYENLRMWNEWIDNTTRTVSMLRQEIGKPHCSERCYKNEWTKLKRNIDNDAHLWTKLNVHTRERLKCYRKMYQKRPEIPNTRNYVICCSRTK